MTRMNEKNRNFLRHKKLIKTNWNETNAEGKKWRKKFINFEANPQIKEWWCSMVEPSATFIWIVVEFKPDARSRYVFSLLVPFPKKTKFWSLRKENRKSPLQRKCLGCAHTKLNKIFFFICFDSRLSRKFNLFFQFPHVPATSTLKKLFPISQWLKTNSPSGRCRFDMPTRATIYLMRFIPLVPNNSSEQASALLEGKTTYFSIIKSIYGAFRKYFNAVSNTLVLHVHPCSNESPNFHAQVVLFSVLYVHETEMKNEIKTFLLSIFIVLRV